MSVSGEVIVSQDSLAASSRAMVVSLPIAVVVTVLIVGMAIRSVRYSIVTILPILLVVFGVWGYMWVRGFTVNVVTATIAVGVGIDFCTHFTVRFREELARTADRLEAVRSAGDGTGGASADLRQLRRTDGGDDPLLHRRRATRAPLPVGGRHPTLGRSGCGRG